MKDRWCVRCGRTTPTPYTLKVLAWRRKANLPMRSVLDLGCGNGRNLRAFQIGSTAKKLVGFDMCVEQAQALCNPHLCRPVKLVAGKLGVDAIPKGRYDIVLMNYCLMFLSPMERCLALLGAVVNLVPGGWLVIELYPAKDSELSTDEDCSDALEETAYLATEEGLSVLRSSKNRMIIQRSTDARSCGGGSRILEGFDKEVKELRSYFWKNCVGGPQKPAKEPKVKYWGGK